LESRRHGRAANGIHGPPVSRAAFPVAYLLRRHPGLDSLGGRARDRRAGSGDWVGETRRRGEAPVTRLIDFVVSLVERLGYLGLALAIAAENLFPPIPSEVILPLAGFNVWEGDFSFPLVILATTAGSVVGALVLYGIGRWLGKERLRALVRDHGRLVFLKVEDVDKADVWFDKYGPPAVFLCRMVPIVRSLISIPAGIDRMRPATFLVLTALGSAIWNSILVGAGWALGTQWSVVEEYVGYFQYVVIAVVLAAVVLFVVRRASARRRRA
jgi:membrane protein DedA with SNARE-associated domain